MHRHKDNRRHTENTYVSFLWNKKMQSFFIVILLGFALASGISPDSLQAQEEQQTEEFTTLREIEAAKPSYLSPVQEAWGEKPSILYPQLEELSSQMTEQEVRYVLMQHQIFIPQNIEKHYFHMQVPFWRYLSSIDTENKLEMDPVKERIYYDDYTFFDLQDKPIQNEHYRFFYHPDKEKYLLGFRRIYTWNIDNVDLLNPNLMSLKVKFYEGKVYALEYTAHMSSREQQIWKWKYEKRFHTSIQEGENTIYGGNTRYFINYSSKEQEIRVIQLDENMYSQIEEYLNTQTSNFTNQLLEMIVEEKNSTQHISAMLLQESKSKIRKRFQEQYQDVLAL